MENRKIILSSYVLTGLLIGFLSRSSIQYFYNLTYKVRRFPGIQVIREALPITLGLVAFFILLNHKKVNVVMDEVVSELKKVTWPSKDDVVKSTIVVLFCVVVASFILGLFDGLWGKLMTHLLYG